MIPRAGANEVRGLEFGGDDDLSLLGDLSYAILNKTRLSYVYDFNGPPSK